ncbi:MAG TPA: hypothetical protein VGL42_03815 [Opitutaceae bacterium]|jgi:hypothetical protein
MGVKSPGRSILAGCVFLACGVIGGLFIKSVEVSDAASERTLPGSTTQSGAIGRGAIVVGFEAKPRQLAGQNDVVRELAQARERLSAAMDRGLGGWIEQPAVPRVRFQMKRIRGVVCVRIATPRRNTILINSRGLWVLGRGRAVRLAFVENQMSALTEALAMKSFDDGPPASPLEGQAFWDDGGRKILKVIAPVGRRLGESARTAVALEHLSGEMTRRTLDALPSRTNYYIDEASVTLVGQSSQDAEGAPVGSALRYDLPGNAIPDATFDIPAGSGSYEANNVGELHKLLMAPEDER